MTNCFAKENEPITLDVSSRHVYSEDVFRLSPFGDFIKLGEYCPRPQIGTVDADKF